MLRGRKLTGKNQINDQAGDDIASKEEVLEAPPITMKRTTLADIATAANVSLMTVSRAINHKPGVSAELRDHILRLADEMGYQPNTIARGLVTRRTATIGLVIPDNTNPFFAQIARGVEDAAFENRYSIFLVNTNEESLREAAALDSLWQKGVDGLILCSSRLSTEALEQQIQRFPAMVLINRETGNPRPNLSTINIDDHYGATLAVAHLHAAGRRRIALIGGPANSTSNRRRMEGYKKGLAAMSQPFQPELIESNAPTTDGGRAACATLLDRKPEIDAIIAYNDLVAIGAMQVCLESGRKVPEDIAIIGFDDIPLASIIRPRLTTLHVNLMEIGSLAIKTLLENLDGDQPPHNYQIEPELVIRDSA